MFMCHKNLRDPTTVVPHLRVGVSAMIRDPAQRAIVALLLALVFGVVAPAARAQDSKPEAAETGTDSVVVNAKDGKQITRKGEIVEETAAKVVLKLSDGKTSTIKREEIARVEYGGQPTGLIKGELETGKNNFDLAANEFGRVAAEIDAGKGRQIWKPRALIAQGRALVSAGKFEDAGKAFVAAAKALPTSIWVREAYREGVRALIRAKNPGEALKFAGDAPAAFKAAEFPDEAQDEAKLLRAEALEASGQAGDARSIYNVLTNSKDVKVRGRALLGAARAAMAQKDTTRAEAQFRAILDEKDVERSVRCGAARGLGDALLSKPGTDKDYAKLRAVAATYAQALAVHSPARGEPTEDREAALHQGALVYDMLAALCKDAKDARARELWTENAKQLRQELVRLYKNSPYRPENEKKLASAAAAAEGPAK